MGYGNDSTTKQSDFKSQGANDIVGIVLLHIQSARDLPRLINMTRTGWDMDPFVVISFGKKSFFRTRVIRHSLNPVWEEKLLFHVRRYETAFQVHLNIFDWHKFHLNDHIGDVNISVKELVESAPQPDSITGLYTQDDVEHLMTEYDLPLLPAKEAWDAKYNPIVTFRAKYQPYDALRQRFWRQYLRQYDTGDTHTMSHLELTSMLDSLGFTLTRSTVSSFFTRFDKKQHDEITIDQAIQCLEAELGRPDSEKKRLDADDSSVGAIPLLSIADGKGHELKLDDLDFSGPHSDDGHPNFKSGPWSDDGDVSSTGPSPSRIPRSAKKRVSPFRRTKKDDKAQGENPNDDSSGSLERVLIVKNCPLCHHSLLNSKAEIDIITHLAVCASKDWQQVNRIAVGNFATASEAQGNLYTKMILMVSNKLGTKAFHSTTLPNLYVSVYYALTTFESANISPWMHPSKWVEANTKHICAIFDGIVERTENEAVKLPETKVFQRLVVYIFAYNMVCLSDNTLLGELNVILKKRRHMDILNLIRNQGNIKKELLTLFGKLSREHRKMTYDGLFRKLLILDSISLSANIEVLMVDKTTYEEVVETTGPAVQSLVNLLLSRLDFPIRPEHKRLLVDALTRLSESSRVYPDSLTLTSVTPERGRQAHGTFADVYKGKCMGEVIALKVFKVPFPRGVNSLDSWTRRSSDTRVRVHNLIHEVFTWRQLSHPNVLPFYGIHFLEDSLEVRFCLVSPWMEHGNIVEFLGRRHRDGPYTDTTDCVSLALDIANGVKYLHGERVIHRDLKGYNILISPSLRAYIADFGLATFTDSGFATTLAGSAIMGTPKWLAPELIPHEETKRHHTYASDIYAFALVCYEMFSGKVPFEDVQIEVLKLLLRTGERPSLPADDLSQRRGLSSEMEGVIRDCWAQEPTKRPSANKVVERLQVLRRHQEDRRSLDDVGKSFFAQLLRAQADNPFAILSNEYHRA